MNDLNNATLQNNVYKKHTQTAVLFFSFCLASILPTIMMVNNTGSVYTALGFTSGLEDKIFFILIFAGLSYFIYSILLKIYLLSMSFSVYSIFMPTTQFISMFNIGYAIKNVAFAVISVVMFAFNLLINWLEVIYLVLDIIFFVVFARLYLQKYIDKMTQPFILRLMFRPFFCYLVLDTIILLVEIF